MFREALALDPELTEAALTLNKLLLHQERYEDVLEIVKIIPVSKRGVFNVYETFAE